MNYLFYFLFLLSFICLVIGIIKPDFFSKILKKEITRGRAGLTFGISTLIFFVLFGVTSPDVQTEKTVQKNSTPNTQQTKKNEGNSSSNKVSEQVEVESAKVTDLKQESSILKHEIIYTVKGKRYDGGNEYYVLIDPTNLENDNFKNEIKLIVKKIVSEKGNKVGIEIHDSRESLEISYKQYGIGTLGRVRTSEEDEIEALHFVAAYDGDLETGLYNDSLMFYLATDSKHPIVGKYVQFLEFDATK